MKSLSVLLVEDNELDAERVRRIIRRAGNIHKLIHATHAQDALNLINEAIAKNEPIADVILLDLNLPGISGLDFLATLRSDPKTSELPVCILSSSNWPSDVEQAKSLDVLNYYIKPITAIDIQNLSNHLNDVETEKQKGEKQRGNIK